MARRLSSDLPILSKILDLEGLPISSISRPYILLLLLILAAFLVYLAVLWFIARPRPTRIPIKGRHVLITGGSSGIGLEIARQVAKEGARVSILARGAGKLEEAREAIWKETGSGVKVLSADVRDAEAVSRAVEEAGPVDVLVLSHGVFLPRELELQDLEDVRFHLDVNVMGTFNLIKAALPAMRRNAENSGLPASIAIMSSQLGQVGIYGYTAYAASKFALRGLAECLQQEVIQDNIYVSLIFPPDTDTPGLKEEVKRRPVISSQIVEGLTEKTAEFVAKKTINGIKSGKFMISCNFDGVLVSIVTAGMSPQSSFLSSFLEISFAGILRFVALCYQWKWYRIVEKYGSKTNRI